MSEAAAPTGTLAPGEARRALAYGALLFVVTRAVLTLLGMLSRAVLESRFGEFYPAAWSFSSVAWLDLWGLWDTGWYFDIADRGYPTGVALEPALHSHGRIGFFPLYPLLGRAVSTLGIPIFEALLLVANAALLVGCAFLYRLVRLDADEASARRALKYLLLFPSAFVLSSALAEPLLLMLSSMVFYWVRVGRLPAAGCAGFALALVKPSGIFFLAPIAWELWLRRGPRLDPAALWMLLMPAGLAAFALFSLWAVGDLFAYSHVKVAQWGIEATNPIGALVDGFREPSLRIHASFIVVMLGLLIAAPPRMLRLSYRLAAGAVIVGTLAAGAPVVASVARYSAALFGFAILLAHLSEREEIDRPLTVALCLLQGGLMVLWSNGLFIV